MAFLKPQEGLTVVNLNGVLSTLEDVKDVLETHAPTIFGKIGAYVMQEITRRTFKKGLGPDDKRLRWHGATPYEPGYERLRKEHKKPVDRVYLKWTGGLLNAMTQHATADMVRVFFSPAPAKPIRLKKTSTTTRKGKKRKYQRKNPTRVPKITEAEKALYVHQDRPFFLLDEDDVKKIQAIFKRYIQQALKETNAPGTTEATGGD